MLISELSFDHLRAEHEAWLTRELERRRVIEERLAHAASATGAAPRRTGLSAALEMLQMLNVKRMPRRTQGPVDPCPTCPSPA